MKKLLGILGDWLLTARWLLGATIFAKQEWRVRIVDDDKDDVEELIAWTHKMKADGWDDMAAFGCKLYLRRFVDRWPLPNRLLYQLPTEGSAT